MSSHRLLIRDMHRDDVAAVRRIESEAYEDAWPSRVFESELENAFAQYRVLADHEERDPPGGPMSALARRIMPEPRDRILAFMGVWYMIDQLHLVTIAVDPREQGRGLGHALMLDCFALANAAELNEIVLEVRVSNERAQRLYDHFGFRRAGTLKDYYKDNHEDAYVMLSGPLNAPTAIERLARLRTEHAERYGDAFEV